MKNASLDSKRQFNKHNLHYLRGSVDDFGVHKYCGEKYLGISFDKLEIYNMSTEESARGN